jgi:hypothetical protein
MDSFSGTLAPHPVVRCVAGMGAALDEVEGLGPAGMTLAEKQETLLELSRQIERAQGLKLAVLAGSEDVAAEHGDRDIASWLAPRTNADPGPTKAALKVAEAIDQRWHRVGTALRGGGCSLEQARVIVAALDELPDQVPAELTAEAEAHLVAQAAHFTPKQLRKLGNKILEVIAPDIAEDAERKNLDAELAKARRTTRLTLKNRGDGTTDLYAKLPDAIAARLRTYLDAHSSPRHDAATNGTATNGSAYLDPATGQRLPADRVRGIAFCALLERIDPKAMPLHGGTPTTLNVTVPLDTLRSGLGVGVLDDGTRIPAGEVRRLACTAGIIPVVLGGKSEVLDLGRVRRFYTGAQKRAMTLEHPTCRAEGCSVPAEWWCDAHHFAKPWAQGGRTDLKDGKLLCPWHHTRSHDDRYLVDELPNGDVRFTRRR